MNKKWLVFVSLWVILPFLVSAEHKDGGNSNQMIDYPVVESPVSFSSVTELPFNQPEEKIVYGTDEHQYGLLWPSKLTEPKPLIVLVHGGCWLNAYGVDHSFPMATALSQLGFPVWSLEYRRTGDEGGGWPGSYEDIKLALSQLDLLFEYNVNISEVILMGHSAGGHLALLAASELKQLEFKQIIGLAAITDITRYALGENSCEQATQQFMGGMPYERSEAYHQANLLYRQLPDSVLLLQGEADQIVPTLQAQLHQVKAELLSGVDHFDWIHPGSAAFQKLLQVIEH